MDPLLSLYVPIKNARNVVGAVAVYAIQLRTLSDPRGYLMNRACKQENGLPLGASPMMNLSPHLLCFRAGVQGRAVVVSDPAACVRSAIRLAA